MAELPLEIITDILIRLPVKSLIRFKCVSKPWKSLISSPNFTHRHLNQTLITNPNPQNLIITHNHTLITAVISARNHIRFAELDHPLKRLPHRPNVGLIESCNGVLFISDYPKETMFLFNPSINSYCLLPKPSPPPASVSGYDEFFGFGYDSLNNDYKVVRLQQWKVDGAGLGRDASVYSLRDDVWKSVKDVTMPYFLQRSHAVAANEMLHFVALTKNYKPVLKCFDLRTNALLIVDYPELESYDFSKMSMSLREVRGHLCLLVSYQNHRGVAMGNPLYNRELKYADLWEMRERGKKESWVKLFRIRKSEIVERCIYLRLVTYSKDERSVLLEVNGKWFGWYDLVSKRIEKVLIQGLGVDDVPYVAMTFVESLVSVSNDKLVLKGGMMPSNDKVVLKGGTTSSNDKAVPNGGTRLSKKNSKKAGFLSSGFKLKL